MATQWSTKDEVSQVKVYRPHVLILGAGASIAALPNGDKHGRWLPSMDNFVEILDLSGLLSKGDAVITAHAEMLAIKTIISENRQFLQTIEGLPLEVVNSARLPLSQRREG